MKKSQKSSASSFRIINSKKKSFPPRRAVFCEPLEERLLLSAHNPLQDDQCSSCAEYAQITESSQPIDLSSLSEIDSVGLQKFDLSDIVTSEDGTFNFLECASLLASDAVRFSEQYEYYSSDNESFDLGDCCQSAEDVTPNIDGVADYLWDSFESREVYDDSDGATAEDVLDTPLITNLDFSSGISSSDSELISDEESVSLLTGMTSGGGAINIVYSGGVVEHNGRWHVTEGFTLLFSVFGGEYGDVVKANIAYNGASPYDFDLANCVSQVVVGGYNTMISLTVLQDNLLNEGNEDFSILFTLTKNGTTSNLSSYSFTIAWTPEFISDVDYGLPNPVVNADRYRTYCDTNVFSIPSGANLNYRYYRTNVEVYQAPTSLVVYSLVADPTNPYDLSQYFQINPYSGVITQSRDLSALINNGVYEGCLTVRAVNVAYNGVSGGNAFADTAEITVSFAKWEVTRMQTSPTASAVAHDGCTVANLAYEMGLTTSEYLAWLTDHSTSDVELFNGSTKVVDELGPYDVLARTERFSIPNTIFAAYCFDPEIMNSSFAWTFNLSGFRALGFYVVDFYNSSFSTNQADFARTTFLNQIDNLSSSKQLHGIYFVGHGGDNSFSTYGRSYGTNWGPQWSVCYGLGGAPSISTRLDYRLGAMIIHACHSSTASTALLSGGLHSVYATASGTTYPRQYFWSGLWGNNHQGYYGGAQGTWVFYSDTTIEAATNEI